MNSRRRRRRAAGAEQLCPYDPGVWIAILIILLAIAIVGLVVLSIRYRQLDRDVDRILTRLEIASTSKVASRALYRGVRGLERRLEDAEISTNRLRVAAEMSNVGVVIADAAVDIVYANPAAQEVISGRLGDAVAGTRIVSLLERVQATGLEEDLELDLYTPARRVVRLRAAPFAEGDRIGGAVGYITDLSELRRVEAMRRDFLTNAGHEMKTPLGALSVLAEAIADTHDADTRQRLTERLRIEANRMAHVVDGILTLADIESFETPFAAVPIAEVVDAAVARVSVAAADARISINADRVASSVVVDGNAEQLVSAIANLLDNAVKHSEPNGDGIVEIAVMTTGNQVSISVRDYGIGISEPHLERIFERFYRVERGRSRSSGGTGLGLSIVNNVARTHGGSVVAESVPAEGSVFTMTLPLRKE